MNKFKQCATQYNALYYSFGKQFTFQGTLNQQTNIILHF